MQAKPAQFPDLENALRRVGTGTGFGSLVVCNGRSRIGHIATDGVSLCGVEKRVAAHYDTDVDNEDEEFRAWLKTNWGTGLICRACLRSLMARDEKANLTSHAVRRH